jgi:hypothetical protein
MVATATCATIESMTIFFATWAIIAALVVLFLVRRNRRQSRH